MSCMCYTQKAEGGHDADFVVTGSTTGCHNDNLWCYQWWQSWHHDNSRFQCMYKYKIALSRFNIFHIFMTDIHVCDYWHISCPDNCMSLLRPWEHPCIMMIKSHMKSIHVTGVYILRKTAKLCIYFTSASHMGQVTKLWLSCYLVLLSIDSKTR